MGLEEPSASEIIRDIQAEVRLIREGQDGLVARAEYESDMREVKNRLTAIENARDAWKQRFLSLFLFPLLVGLVLALMGVRL